MIFFKKTIIFLIIFINTSFLTGCAIQDDRQVDDKNYSRLTINNIVIPVEVVDTQETRRLGLSYRESLDRDSGMLFDMKSRMVNGFWMKDMNFPLDIIWIDGDKIMNINKNLPPAGKTPKVSYSSEVPINFVLEVNGGFCDEKNIKIGDKVIFDIK